MRATAILLFCVGVLIGCEQAVSASQNPIGVLARPATDWATMSDTECEDVVAEYAKSLNAIGARAGVSGVFLMDRCLQNYQTLAANWTINDLIIAALREQLTLLPK